MWNMARTVPLLLSTYWGPASLTVAHARTPSAAPLFPDPHFLQPRTLHVPLEESMNQTTPELCKVCFMSQRWRDQELQELQEQPRHSMPQRASSERRGGGGADDAPRGRAGSAELPEFGDTARISSDGSTRSPRFRGGLCIPHCLLSTQPVAVKAGLFQSCSGGALRTGVLVCCGFCDCRLTYHCQFVLMNHCWLLHNSVTHL